MPGGTKPPVGPLGHEVGRIIRARLAYKEWTHGQLAEKVDMSASQMSRMLKGDRHMDVDLLAQICDVLGLDIVSDVWRVAQSAVEREQRAADDAAAAAAEIARADASEQARQKPLSQRRKASGS